MSEEETFGFRQRLKQSQKEVPRWNALLPSWPRFRSVRYTPNSPRQRYGCDCIVSAGNRIHETELKMIYHKKWFNNILLEQFSGDYRDDPCGKQGWMELYECDFLVWGWWEFNRAIVISFPKLRAVYYERKWDKRKWIKNTKQSEDERTGRLWWTWNVAVGLPELRKHVGYWELHSESSTRSTCAANVESPSNASGSLLGD